MDPFFHLSNVSVLHAVHHRGCEQRMRSPQCSEPMFSSTFSNQLVELDLGLTIAVTFPSGLRGRGFSPYGLLDISRILGVKDNITSSSDTHSVSKPVAWLRQNGYRYVEHRAPGHDEGHQGLGPLRQGHRRPPDREGVREERLPVLSPVREPHRYAPSASTPLHTTEISMSRAS
eukprot:666850-Pyramimonas_sp.AAC.1